MPATHTQLQIMPTISRVGEAVARGPAQEEEVLEEEESAVQEQVGQPEWEETLARHQQEHSQTHRIYNPIDIYTHCHSDGQHTPADL